MLGFVFDYERFIFMVKVEVFEYVLDNLFGNDLVKVLFDIFFW